MDLLCLDFMNSDWRDYRGGGGREDRLRDPAWVEGFLTRWRLEVDDPPSRTALAHLTKLRELLWGCAATLASGGELDAAALDSLNAFLGGSTATRRLERSGTDYRLVHQAGRRDWSWVAAEIAASFADLLANRDPERLKICDNEDCRWAFYDESKNRTRRWCGDTCGNLIKVRRFRDARSR